MIRLGNRKVVGKFIGNTPVGKVLRGNNKLSAFPPQRHKIVQETTDKVKNGYLVDILDATLTGPADGREAVRPMAIVGNGSTYFKVYKSDGTPFNDSDLPTNYILELNFIYYDDSTDFGAIYGYGHVFNDKHYVMIDKVGKKIVTGFGISAIYANVYPSTGDYIKYKCVMNTGTYSIFVDGLPLGSKESQVIVTNNQLQIMALGGAGTYKGNFHYFKLTNTDTNKTIMEFIPQTMKYGDRFLKRMYDVNGSGIYAQQVSAPAIPVIEDDTLPISYMNERGYITSKPLGKNLVNPNNVVYVNSNVSFNSIPNGLHVTSSAGTWKRIIIDNLKIKPNTTYSISYILDAISGTKDTCFMSVIPTKHGLPVGAVTEFLKNFIGLGSKSGSFNSGDNTGIYILVFLSKGVNGAYEYNLTNLQIEESDSATAYEPIKLHSYDEAGTKLAPIGARTTARPDGTTAWWEAELANYTVTATSGPNGIFTVNGGASYTGHSGAALTFSIVPNLGYEIDTQTPRPTTIVGNATYNVTFKQIEYTVTATSGPNGIYTVNGGASYTGHSGDVLEFAIVPSADYVVNSQPITPTKLTENATYNVTFKQMEHTVTVTSGPNGSAKVNGYSSITGVAGTVLTFTSEANEHYAFKSWSAPLPTVIGTQSLSLGASFEAIQYTVNVVSSGHGTPKVNGESSVTGQFGTALTFTDVPESGYSPAVWTPAKLNSLTGNVTYTATFEAIVPTQNYFATFNETNYIDLGFKHNATTKIDTRCRDDEPVSTATKFSAIVGARDSSNNNEKGLAIMTGRFGAGTKQHVFLNDTVVPFTGASDNLFHTKSLYADVGDGLLDGAVIFEGIPFAGACQANMHLNCVKTFTGNTRDDVGKNTYDWFQWEHDGVIKLLNFTEGSGNVVKDNLGNSYTVGGDPVVWTPTDDPIKHLPTAPTQYTVSVSSDTNGAALVNGQPSVTGPAGTAINITYVPNGGYELDAWSVNPLPSTIAANQTITATSKLSESYQIPANAVYINNPPTPLVACSTDGTTDVTDNLKAIMTWCNTNNRVCVIPAGHTFVITKIEVTGFSNFTLVGLGELKRKDNDTIRDIMLTFWNASLLRIEGLRTDGNIANNNINGNRLIEHAHNLKLGGCTTVVINDFYAKNPCGDGLYIRNTQYVDAGLISVVSEGDFCGRNGLSIVSGHDMDFEEVISTKVGIATMPGGIDLEPNNINDALSNITVHKGTISSKVQGVSIACNKGPIADNIKLLNIVNTTYDDPSNYAHSGVTVYNAKNSHVQVNIHHGAGTDNTSHGFYMIDAESTVLDVTVHDKCAYGGQITRSNGCTIKGGLLGGCNQDGLLIIGACANNLIDLTIKNTGIDGNANRAVINNSGTATNFTFSGDYAKANSGVNLFRNGGSMAGTKLINLDMRGFSATNQFVGNDLGVTQITNALGYPAVSILSYGAVANNGSDATSAIQSALDANDRVTVPSGTFSVNPDVSIKLKDGQTLTLEQGAVLKALASSNSFYRIVLIDGKSNVVVNGSGKIEGERTTHVGTTGEHGMGISVLKSANVLIDGITVTDCWGDGIYVGGASVPTTNTTIKNVVADNNRRQGISIVHADGYVVEDCILKETKGTQPAAGIDIEPNANLFCKNGRISRVKAYNNEGDGILLAGYFALIDTITVEDCECYNNGKLASNAAGKSGFEARHVQNLTAKNINSHDNGWCGFLVKRDLKDSTFTNCNFDSNAGPGAQLEGYTDFFFGISNVVFNNCTFNNNSKATLDQWSGLSLIGMATVGNLPSTTVRNCKANDTSAPHMQRWGISVSNTTDVSRIDIDNSNEMTGNVHGPLFGYVIA